MGRGTPSGKDVRGSALWGKRGESRRRYVAIGLAAIGLALPGQALAAKPGPATPPETLIASGPAEASFTAATSATFTFSSDARNVSFECKLDGGAYTRCSS